MKLSLEFFLCPKFRTSFGSLSIHPSLSIYDIFTNRPSWEALSLLSHGTRSEVLAPAPMQLFSAYIKFPLQTYPWFQSLEPNNNNNLKCLRKLSTLQKLRSSLWILVYQNLILVYFKLYIIKTKQLVQLDKNIKPYHS